MLKLAALTLTLATLLHGGTGGGALAGGLRPSAALFRKNKA